MKPRLMPAPLTPEDRAIWLGILGQVKLSPSWAFYKYPESDQRDAELMYVAQWRWRTGYRQSRPWCPYKGPLEIYDYGQRLLLGGQL